METSNSDILNRVFSKNTIRSFIRGIPPVSYVTAIKRYVKNNQGTNLQKISEIYEYLCQNHRNEYCYKNTLLNKLLVESPIHSFKTTTALTEIPINKSKADFVLINGKSVVYEIKTGLDNFERLETQLSDYYKAFDNVAVVTDKSSLPALYKHLQDFKNAGICVLNDDFSLEMIKKPVSQKESLDFLVMFKILRKYEFESILKRQYGFLPKVSQFQYYEACFELIKKIDMECFFEMFKKMLKKRTVIIESEFLNLPKELKMLGYFSSLKQNDYAHLNDFLKKSYA